MSTPTGDHYLIAGPRCALYTIVDENARTVRVYISTHHVLYIYVRIHIFSLLIFFAVTFFCSFSWVFDLQPITCCKYSVGWGLLPQVVVPSKPYARIICLVLVLDFI